MSLNTGKSIGRVSIRALPDTKHFRRDLLQKLRRVEETTSIGVTVDKARVNRTKIRESIRTQLEGMDGVEIDANVKVTIDKAKLKKVALRKSIQEQFDELGDIRVGIEAHINNAKAFQHQVDSMVRQASRKQVKINVNAATAGATAQMKWLSRDRFVELIPRVSKAAALKAATTIAAISGGRVAFDWVKDLLEKIGNLDRALPTIALATTGLTSLGAVLLGSVSGIVGLGQGLVSMTPLLLLVPGLILNAAGSLTVLAVAMKDASKELAPLKDDMAELRTIISSGFWDKAREPIINLVEGLMPQLRNSFELLSDGVGTFVGSLADSFAEKLGGGRLESIFANIDEGWRILSKGTDGFAGAIVSLSEIAAKYTPRLSKWFVRQVDAFDGWLTAIANDGRLDQWIEDGIDATYQLWDAAKGTAGIFQGIWKAAEAAGSGGLKGFSEMLLRWSDIVNGPKFQKGLTALFSGANAALGHLGDGFVAFGNLIADNSSHFEHFIATSGEAFGGLMEDIANALNQPKVAKGFDDFINGIRDGLDGFGDYLPKIGEGFGSLLSTAGALASEIGPVLGSALGAVTDFLTPIADTLREDVIPILGPELKKAIDELAPKLGTLGEKLAPVVEKLGTLAVNTLPAIVGALESAIDLALPILDGAGRSTPDQRDPNAHPGEQFLSGLGELGSFLLNVPSIPWFLDTWSKPFEEQVAIVQGIIDGDWGVMWSEAATAAVGFGEGLRGTFDGIGTFLDEFRQRWENFWEGNGFVTDAEVTGIEDKIKGGMGGGMSAMNGFQTQAQPMWSGFMTNLHTTASTAWSNIVTSVQTGVGNAVTWIASLPGRIGGVFAGVGSWLYESGRALLQGFVNGITSMVSAVVTAVQNAVAAAARFFPHSPALEGPFSGRGWTGYSGAALMDDFADGIRSRTGAAQAALGDAMRTVAPEVPTFAGIAAATSSGAAPVQRITNITNNNPAPEPASTSITRSLDKVAYLGLDEEDGDL